MNVEMLCNVIEERFDAVDTLATPELNSVRVDHSDFSLLIELIDEQILIHDIVTHATHQGIGSAVVSHICSWAWEEEIDVVTLNVIPEAESWWKRRGFSRINQGNDLYYSAEAQSVDDDNILNDDFETLSQVHF
jgi:hypothetical protein